MDLSKNSKEMATVVETFVIEETASLIYDGEQLDNWHQKCKELGLEGQSQIVKTDKSPIPFMHLKTSLCNVLRTLCPREVAVEKYNVTPIPLEILDLIALSKKEGYFNEIKIWYDDATPDPCCVGLVKKFGEWGKYDYNTKEEASQALGKAIQDYSYETKYYLLGKWADVKHSFEELTEMAKNRFKTARIAQYSQEIKEATRKLEDVENEAYKAYNEGTGSGLSTLPF